MCYTVGGVIFLGVTAVLASGYLIFPWIFGATIGNRVSTLAEENKTRSLLWVSVLGFLGGLVGYGVCLGLRAIILGSVDSSYSMKVLSTPIAGNWGDWPSLFDNDSGSSVNLPILLSDILIVHGTAILLPYRKIKRKPFCSRCNEWYTEWTKGDVEPDALPGLLQSLETGSIQTLANLPLAKDLPKATIALEKCPSCFDSDMQLTVTVSWQDQPKSKPNGSRRTKQWLRVMVPAAYGQNLSDLLVADQEIGP
jgi:hypothetical protein